MPCFLMQLQIECSACKNLTFPLGCITLSIGLIHYLFSITEKDISLCFEYQKKYAHRPLNLCYH